MTPSLTKWKTINSMLFNLYFNLLLLFFRLWTRLCYSKSTIKNKFTVRCGKRLPFSCNWDWQKLKSCLFIMIRSFTGWKFLVELQNSWKNQRLQSFSWSQKIAKQNFIRNCVIIFHNDTNMIFFHSSLIIM